MNIKTITKAEEKKIPYYDMENGCELITEETKIHLHYFVGNNDFWVFKYNPEEKTFYGFMSYGRYQNLMTMTIKDLEKPLNIPFLINGKEISYPMKWEKERNFKPQTLKQVAKNEKSGLDKFRYLKTFIEL